MQGDVSVMRVIAEVINPVLNLFAAFLRPLGILAAGVLAGSVLRYTLLYRFQRRFSVGLIFLGLVALFWIVAEGQWSSPATLAALGFGVLIGYMMRSNLPIEAPTQSEVQNVHGEESEP